MARRKKTKKSATPLTSLLQTQTVPSAAVALLIDGENVIAPDQIDYILAEASKMGKVVIRHVYGNWTTPSMQPWKEMMTTPYSLEAKGNVQTTSGHNATDIALVIGAMDLLYRGVRHFCLVAGDSDYIPLVLRLHQDGCVVLGVGMSNASQALRDACNNFLPLGQSVAHKTSSSTSTVVVPASSKPAHSEKKLDTALINAYRHIVKNEDEWIDLASLGNALRDLDPHFQDTSYGKKKLSTLIKQCPNLFEAHLEGKITKVRLKRLH